MLQCIWSISLMFLSCFYISEGDQKKVSIDKAPFVAVIRHHIGTGFIQLGAIITKRHVITYGKEIKLSIRYKFYNKTDFSIVTSTDKLYWYTPNFYEIEDIIFHPSQADYEPLSYELTLIKVVGNIDRGTSIALGRAVPDLGAACKHYGFGVPKKEKNTMMKLISEAQSTGLELYVTDIKVEKSYKKTRTIVGDNKTFNARVFPLPGDLGAPLVHEGRLVGLGMARKWWGNYETARSYNSYIAVPRFLDWVARQMPPVPRPPPPTLGTPPTWTQATEVTAEEGALEEYEDESGATHLLPRVLLCFLMFLLARVRF